ncbi:MAG: M1 family metallopeptidase [Planctomycetota bacterium]
MFMKRSLTFGSGVVLLLVGCSGPVAVDTDDLSLNYGAVDPEFRRGGGVSDNAFDPLDMPTPNERRLGSGFPGPDYWDQRADYVIDATVDETSDALRASWSMTYHNNSPHTLEYLWIQLEQNLFHPDSLGARSYSPGGVLRGRPDFEGGYAIENVKIEGVGAELDIHDTLGRLDLLEPLGPGESVEVSLDYSFLVPPYLRRMGVEEVERGKIFEFAQWFPHACNYDDVSGWNTLPYLGTGEFYTNFGDYEVSITVPGDYLVVATGELQNASEVLSAPIRERLERALVSDEPVYIVSEDEIGSDDLFPGSADTRTWKFAARCVRTFAFAASDAFVWDAAGANIPTIDGDPICEGGVPNHDVTRRVLCQSFYPSEAEVWFPEHEDGGSTRYTKHAIEFYSEWLYPYPYPHMTNVNGPEGGMEYPMIMFCGARTNPRGLFGVTDHEVGHTWFPMIVNTDERRHVWMDEGFNSFTDSYSERAWYGEDELDWVRTKNRLTEFAREPGLQPISTRPDNMWRRWVGLLGYRKPGIGMTILREYILGPDRFDRAFRAYIQKWAFKSPQPADFFRAMEDGSGVELDWFFRAWFLGTGSVDFAIESAELAEDGESGYVTFVMKGEVPLPLPYRVTLADGTELDLTLPVEAFASTGKWRAVFDANGQEIEKVEIDPRGLIPDINPRDNVWGR